MKVHALQWQNPIPTSNTSPEILYCFPNDPCNFKAYKFHIPHIPLISRFHPTIPSTSQQTNQPRPPQWQKSQPLLTPLINNPSNSNNQTNTLSHHRIIHPPITPPPIHPIHHAHFITPEKRTCRAAARSRLVITPTRGLQARARLRGISRCAALMTVPLARGRALF